MLTHSNAFNAYKYFVFNTKHYIVLQYKWSDAKLLDSTWYMVCVCVKVPYVIGLR